MFTYLLEMVYFDDPSLLKWVINCKDGYFVVFPKKWAPSQQRWKKIKQRIMPSEFGIDFSCEPIFLAPESDVEKVRERIEKESEG